MNENDFSVNLFWMLCGCYFICFFVICEKELYDFLFSTTIGIIVFLMKLINAAPTLVLLSVEYQCSWKNLSVRVYANFI